MNPDQQRARMVEEQIKARGLTEERLLAAFRKVPRHLFVPEELQARAYEDHPLQIGCGQTISQPLMTAIMVAALRLQGHERVLEIGTGSGYQTAILSLLALEVCSIDRLPELAADAAARLEQLGFANVDITIGDGTLGWPERAPFDGIIVAAAAPRLPHALREQLADGGRLVIPRGDKTKQTLYVMEKRGQTLQEQRVTECMFVPLVGQDGWAEG